jgi:hypothetical protein
MEKGLRRFSFPVLLVTCCRPKLLTASEQSRIKPLYIIFVNYWIARSRRALYVLTVTRWGWVVRTTEARFKPASALFFDWRNPVPAQLAISPFTDTSLFAHGFSTDAILTGLTDAPFNSRHRFSANHALSLFFTHRPLSCSKKKPCQVLFQHFDLSGILKDQLQSVLRMILDFSLQFNLFALESLRLQFAFFE